MTLLTDKILAELLDAAPDAMLTIGDDGLIVMANGQAQLLFNYQEQDLLGLPMASLVPDVAPSLRGQTSANVLTGLRHGGEEFRAEITLSALVNGSRSLVTAVVRDVSAHSEREAERKRVGSQAEDERRETKAALVTAEDEKVVADEARVVAEAALVTAERETALAEHARLEAEVERFRCEVEIAETEHARLEAEVQRVKAEAEKSEAERLLLEAEVERVRCEAEIAEAEHARLEAEVVLERLEAQLHQSQRMESLGQLAGGAAHDFNNLLAVIMNYASFVSEELTTAAATSPGPNWDDLLNDVQQIQVAADRASVLTHQLLAFARREVVQVRPLNLNSAVRSIEEILRRTIGEQIALTITLDPLLPAVMADPGQVEQVILNLAINARDAMPSGGTLSIATSSREISSAEYSVFDAPAGSYTCLRVSDNGAGMSNAVRDRAFEPFFTTKPKGEGTGLGLATVYGIILQSGGFTRIYSDEGVGTTVTVLLPAKTSGTELRTRDEFPQDLSAPTGTETVLVVDDEEGLRVVTKRILNRSGYKVITASNGAEALQVAKSYVGTIDLLLTDVVMATMQGPSVAKEVTKLIPGIRVLFMSGHAQPVLEAEAVLGTAFHLVEKPFDQKMLLESVRTTLDTQLEEVK